MTVDRSPRPRTCNVCGQDIVFATRADTGRRVPYEAADRPPESAGCHVLVGDQAWRIPDLVEHFQVRYETTEAAARKLVEGYPHHRPHFHSSDTTSPKGTDQ